MFKQRNYDRTEHDDFVLNVQPYLGQDDGAVPVYDADGKIVGWKIKPIYE